MKNFFTKLLAGTSLFALLVVSQIVAQNISSPERVEASYLTNTEYQIAQAKRVAASIYGDTISVDAKAKNLIKFGGSGKVGTDSGGYTIMSLAGSETEETYVNKNDITHIASSSASDTQKIVVEGQVREVGGVFRAVEDVTASNAGPGIFKFNPYVVIPPNADVRLQAVSSAANTDVTGSIQGFLAIVQ